MDMYTLIPYHENASSIMFLKKILGNKKIYNKVIIEKKSEWSAGGVGALVRAAKLQSCAALFNKSYFVFLLFSSVFLSGTVGQHGSKGKHIYFLGCNYIVTVGQVKKRQSAM